MSKRYNKIVISLFLVVAVLALAACSGGAPAQQPAAKAPAPEKPKEQFITFTAGGVGGSWYIVAAGLNEAFEKEIPGLKATIVPGGGTANPTRVNEGKEAHIGLTYAGNAMSAMKGVSEYTEKHTDMMGIANLNMQQSMHIFLRKDLGVKTFADILAKKPALKISVGPRGSGSELMMNRTLKAHGITYDDIKAWKGEIQFTSPTDGSNAVRDGQANGISASSVLANPYLVDVATARDMVMIPLEADKIDAMVKEYGYSPFTVPKGTYKGQDEDIASLSDSVVFIVNKNVDEDTVYQMTKILCENKPKWVGIHSMWQEFEVNKAANMSIPIHPGALKYYKEKGLVK